MTGMCVQWPMQWPSLELVELQQVELLQNQVVTEAPSWAPRPNRRTSRWGWRTGGSGGRCGHELGLKFDRCIGFGDLLVTSIENTLTFDKCSSFAQDLLLALEGACVASVWVLRTKLAWQDLPLSEKSGPWLHYLHCSVEGGNGEAWSSNTRFNGGAWGNMGNRWPETQFDQRIKQNQLLERCYKWLSGYKPHQHPQHSIDGRFACALPASFCGRSL